MEKVVTLKWENWTLLLLDQTILPNEVKYQEIKTVEETYVAIRDMIVRGAPAIGVAAGYGMALAAYKIEASNSDIFLTELAKKAAYLNSARPTAVNLSWAVDRMMKKAQSLKDKKPHEIVQLLEKEAINIHEEDIAINKAIGENLLSLLHENDTVLTHCNAGALATSDYGTALSPFYLAKERGMKLSVYADETRPRLQGARLTSFELHSAGIDVTLISDNMAAVVMSQGKIDAVIVGCDRIAANGDTANKVGTFNVSILAKKFGVPMYIAAPTPTIDMNCESGKLIPIEERDGDEILCIHGEYIAPKDMKTYNPSFDVTPAENITAIVTERGIVLPPFSENLRKIMEQ